MNEQVARPELHVSAGVLLYKPADVAASWRALLGIRNGLNEENRLNVYEVQAGRCLFLPPQWNVVWMYERQRLGLERRFASRTGKALAKARTMLKVGERGERIAALNTLRDSHMLHFGYEHEKIFWICADDIASMTSAAKMAG